ncbi:MAG: hypothetical protein LBM70_09050 [Victivallales bacterium]|jgi:hypothetical protein|nr:hypothetical protein [Victivallales bacterium]
MAQYKDLKIGNTPGAVAQILTLQSGDTGEYIYIYPDGRVLVELGAIAEHIALEAVSGQYGGELAIAGEVDVAEAHSGKILVANGGKTSNVKVWKDAKINVDSGGEAIDVLMEDSNSVGYDFNANVRAKVTDGILINSTANNSYNYNISSRQDVANGYNAFQCTVSPGTIQDVQSGGIASYTTIQRSGRQIARSGAVANVSTVQNEGEFLLESGAKSNYALVEYEGKMEAQAGSYVNNVTVSPNGLLILQDGSIVNGVSTISGRVEASSAVNSHRLILSLTYAMDTLEPIVPENIPVPLLNDINFFLNTDLQISVDFGHQAFGEYKLAGNASAFTGSITLTDENFLDAYASLTVGGKAFVNGRRSYALSVNSNDELILTVKFSGEDVTAPDPIRSITSVVYQDNWVYIHWGEGSDDVAVTEYEFRYAEKGSEKWKTVKTNETFCLFDDFKAGTFRYQVRGVDFSGKAGAWSPEQTFTTVTSSNNDDLTDEPILLTDLWGHDYLPVLYQSANPPRSNDVSGYYFADAEKLLNVQDQQYCWAAASSNILTWGGWAKNSSAAFPDEDRTFEHFIANWKNEGGEWQDAFSWFLTGENATGRRAVPVDGGKFFPTFDFTDHIITVEADETGQDPGFGALLLTGFSAGYGAVFGIRTDAGMSHAITGWGFEQVGKETYIYYSDSDSDMWGGSGDRRDATNRLSKTRLDYNKKDGRFYLTDYQVENTYLSIYSLLRQYDKKFSGESETFSDSRRLEFSDNAVLRAGNLDAKSDDDYYVFSNSYTCEIDLRVVMNNIEDFVSGICISLYDAAKNLLYEVTEAALEQTYSFTAAANLDYYLVVLGNAVNSNDSLPIDIDNYRVEISAEKEWKAGISADDDTAQQVFGNAEYSYSFPAATPVINPQNLFTTTVTPAGTTTPEEVDNYVGKEDKVDMRSVKFGQAGSYNLSLTVVVDKLSLIVYRLNNGKLKKIKSVKVGAKTEDAKRGIFGLKLEAETDYIVAVKSSSKKIGTYNVSLSGEVYTKAVRADDTYAQIASDLSYNVSVAKKSDAFATLDPLSLFDSNWVGFGDTADYRTLKLADSGSYNFASSILDDKATGTFTLWRLNDNGKLKKVASVKGSYKQEHAKNNVLLESGTYVVAFKSKNYKSYNTDYSVSLSGTIFGKANMRDDNDWQHATTVSPGAAVRDEWVGYSDLKDFFRFNVDTQALYQLELSGVGDNSAKLTLYRQSIDKKGNEKSPVKISSVKSAAEGAGLLETLDAGIYYFAVEAQGNTKKSGTLYNVDLTINPKVTELLA